MTAHSDEQFFLSTACSLAQEAGAAILELLKNPIIQGWKEDHSIVTEADLKADAVLRGGLSRAFPDHAILTEETGFIGNRESVYIWVVDPLDGSRAYAKGISGFSVMVGLLKDQKPCLGVVVDPLEGHLYEALKGKGAFHTLGGVRKRLQVSKRRDFQNMPLVTSKGFPEELLNRLQQHLKSPLVEPINSVGIKVGLLVRQAADIYINHHSVHYWDTCAPQIILEEAGGLFTRADGLPLNYRFQAPFSHNSLTLATNGTRHDDLVKEISRFIPLRPPQTFSA